MSERKRKPRDYGISVGKTWPDREDLPPGEKVLDFRDLPSDFFKLGPLAEQPPGDGDPATD
ncbi:hypothetical protein KGQ20_19400 [Catenulispora sp. NF23]|uniref:hypothetical protein n=1 Tax=Catenulispora pinistramenti TaxID=2705254 RepID=UPI001BAC0A4A|nr:hypothetical protein [Catenulispora pinistramenti]MBS2534940.1 hypothetical protein [Catenulispora pinistramenti]